MTKLFDFRGGRSAIGLLCLRLMVGSALTLHGWAKFSSPGGPLGWNKMLPPFWQGMAVAGELLGGLGLLVGFLTPIAAFGVFCTMAVALLLVHFPHHDPFVSASGGHSWELAGAYLVSALTIALAGPGAISLDWLIFGRQSKAPLESP